MPRYDKVIVTNAGVLTAKYGKRRAAVFAAVDALIHADSKRQLSSVRIDLDNVRTMARFHGDAVTDATSAKQNKDAVDAVCRALAPDFLMILGSTDVVPYQDLINPVYSEDDDNDEFASGDLPYACAHPYSRTIASFRHPTRVVGRLPDVRGGTDARYLARLLQRAANYKMRPRSDYQEYLGMTAKPWENSTALSLANLFGNSSQLQLSPPRGPKWSRKLMGTRSHFINCHGALSSPQFFGQGPGRNEFPVAHDASYIRRSGHVVEGTVVAAECCYGAELYDPDPLRPHEMGICNRYLVEGAYGFFGSSTIAYGPSDGNGYADLICQYFLDRVLRGASLGRAALEARLQFIQAAEVLDPVDLKTLGQFNLLGDPSVQPVARAKSAMATSGAFADAFTKSGQKRSARGRRREWLIRNAHAIGNSAGVTRRARRGRPSTRIAALLGRAVRETGARLSTIHTHVVDDPYGRKIPEFQSLDRRGLEVHLGIGSRERRGALGSAAVDGKTRQITIVVAASDRAGIVRMRRVHSRGAAGRRP